MKGRWVGVKARLEGERDRVERGRDREKSLCLMYLSDLRRGKMGK